MKNINLAAILKIAAALVFLSGPLKAAEKAPETLKTPVIGLSAAGKTPALPGDFRDSPGALKAGCAASLQVLNKIKEDVIYQKAAYRAAGIEKPGFPNSAAAVNFEKRTFKLVKKPEPDIAAALEGMLFASYNTAVKNYAGSGQMKIGFTYSLAPMGVVNPFSEIEVSCIMQKTYALSSGAKICGDFFRELNVKIKRDITGLLCMI